MRMRHILLITALIIVALPTAGHSQSETDSRFNVCTTVFFNVIGSNTKLIYITGDRPRGAVERTEDVMEKLKEFLAKDEVNINRIKTVYDQGFLVSAEVLYTTTFGGWIRHVQAQFIHSGGIPRGKKGEHVIKCLQEKLESLRDMIIIDVKTIYRGGEPVAAEIYYYEEERN